VEQPLCRTVTTLLRRRRHASAQILAVLQRYGPAERLGMDEVFVDVTDLVEQRLGLLQRQQEGQQQEQAQQQASPGLAAAVPSSSSIAFRGHVYDSSMRLRSETVHRPQDLRAAPSRQQAAGSAGARAGPGGGSHGAADGDGSCWQLRLAMGSLIAEEMRAAVELEAGFRWAPVLHCQAGAALTAQAVRSAAGNACRWCPSHTAVAPALCAVCCCLALASACAGPAV
jgi:hypothetical protein